MQPLELPFVTHEVSFALPHGVPTVGAAGRPQLRLLAWAALQAALCSLQWAFWHSWLQQRADIKHTWEKHEHQMPDGTQWHAAPKPRPMAAPHARTFGTLSDSMWLPLPSPNLQ